MKSTVLQSKCNDLERVGIPQASVLQVGKCNGFFLFLFFGFFGAESWGKCNFSTKTILKT